jgi:O-antigen ligase
VSAGIDVAAPRPSDSGRVRGWLRGGVLAALALAPLLFGAVHEPAWIPLVVVASAAGLWSRWQARQRRHAGLKEARIPGGRLLLSLQVVVLLQLLPLPPGLLRRVSPGSFAFYEQASLLPLAGFRPISVSPADTARGLVLLLGMSLLYAAVFREFRDPLWRHRIARVVVWTAFVATLVGFIQATVGETRIYGLWRPAEDWAVFGPYVNRNYFADYVAMAIPLAVARCLDALAVLRHTFARRRFLALGEPAGNAAARRLAVIITLVAGLVAAGSRGAFVAFAASATLLALVLPTARRTAGALLLGASLVAAYAIGLEGIVTGFEVRGLRASRIDLWADALRLPAHFPWLGAGLNTFGTAYPPYQTFWPSYWVGHVHNEYLQALIDTGRVGALLVVGLLLVLFRNATRGARRSAFSAAVLCSVLAQCLHNLVDANWQIPANAATFAALAALAVQPPESRASAPEPSASPEPPASADHPAGPRAVPVPFRG